MSIKETLAKGAGKLKRAGAVIAGDRGIYSRLKEEHAEISALMKQAKRGDQETRSQLYPKIRRELLSHAKAEDKEFYAILEQHGETQERTRINRSEHDQIESLLGRLSALSVTSDEWENLFDELIEAVEGHVRVEENELFPKAKKVIDDKRARELEHRFVEQKRRELEVLQAPVGAPATEQQPPEQRPTP